MHIASDIYGVWVCIYFFLLGTRRRSYVRSYLYIYFIAALAIFFLKIYGVVWDELSHASSKTRMHYAYAPTSYCTAISNLGAGGAGGRCMGGRTRSNTRSKESEPARKCMG